MGGNSSVKLNYARKRLFIMKIGIAGPIQTVQLGKYLEGLNLDKTPEGLGGIPVTQLVKGLLKMGHEVSVYSLNQNIKKRAILMAKT